MRYLILFLLLSTPLHAQEWLQQRLHEIDVENGYGLGGYNAPQPRYDDPAPPTIADQPITPAWQPQPYQEDDNLHDWQYLQPADQPQAQYRTPAERLSDCAYNHDCQGEFAP